MLDTTLRQTLSGAWVHQDAGHFSGNGIDCSQKLTLDIRMALHLMHERRDSWELPGGPRRHSEFHALAHALFPVPGNWTFQCRRFAIRAKKALPEIGIHRKTWVK